MTPPRRARAAEYRELISFLNSIFHRRMDLEYAHIYEPTQKDMANNIVVFEGGRIISCVGIFPMTLVRGDVRLSAGGIGGVSTDPQYRGRGLMSKLLEKAISLMRRRNYDISILWGDRRRYANFGWENGGRQYVFNIDRRYVLPRKYQDGDIRRFSHSRDDLRRIARLYEQGELRVLRTRGQLRSVLNRYTYETWVWRKGEDFAYVTVRIGDGGELMEFGGDLGGLDNLLGFVFEEYELENLKGRAAIAGSPYLPFLINHSSEWGVRFVAMVKILNLKSVLEKFAGQIEQGCQSTRVKEDLTLEMADSGQLATIHFGTTVRISEEKAERKLALSDAEMVRLVFGTILPSEALGLDRSLRYLDAIFPLDFYVGGLDYV